MNRKIGIISICLTVGLLFGCEQKQASSREESLPVAPKEAPARPAPSEGALPDDKAEEAAVEVSPCAGPDCQKACSAYEGDELQRCAQAYGDGCFGPDRIADECGPFGASERPSKRKKKEGVGDSEPGPGTKEDPGDAFGTPSDEDSNSAVDLHDDTENDGPVEKTPDKQLLDRPHPD